MKRWEFSIEVMAIVKKSLVRLDYEWQLRKHLHPMEPNFVQKGRRGSALTIRGRVLSFVILSVISELRLCAAGGR